MEISFKGKRALVTGASKGIGRDIALQLAKCGAHVIAVARNPDQLETLKQQSPSSIDTIALDLSNWQSTNETLSLSKIGPIDLLVNNAGIAILKPVNQYTEQDVDRLFATNVKAVINLTQMIAKGLIGRKAPGSIVNISSQTAMIGLQDHAVYCGTKGAVDAFTRAAALELGPHNIRVNCINPTVINTEMTRMGWTDPERIADMVAKIPLRRFGEVREVADATLFLLSDKASMISGASLLVDGGYVAV